METTTYSIRLSREDLDIVISALDSWAKVHPHWPKYKATVERLITDVVMQDMAQTYPDGLDED